MNEHLRSIDPKDKNLFSRMLMQKIAKLNECDISIVNDENFATCRIIGQDPNTIIDSINKNLISTLNNYIENEMESDPSYYNRSVVFFESEVIKDGVIVRWSV